MGTYILAKPTLFQALSVSKPASPNGGTLKKYLPSPIAGIALGVSVVALVVSITAYAITMPSTVSSSSYDDTSDGYSAPDTAPGLDYQGPDDGFVGGSQVNGTANASLDPATGRITRLVDTYGDVIFDDGYTGPTQELPYSPLGGLFGGSNVAKTTITDPKGQQTILTTTFQSSTQSEDPRQLVQFYNQYVAKPINPAAPPLEYLPDLGGMISDYAQSAIATALQKGTIAAPVYTVVGSPLTISDGNGSTCTQETVALTNQADLQKQLDAAVGAPDLISISITNAAGSVTFPNTGNCQTLLAQAQGQPTGGAFPTPPGFITQDGDGSGSSGQVSGGTSAGSDGGENQGGTTSGGTSGDSSALGGNASGGTGVSGGSVPVSTDGW